MSEERASLGQVKRIIRRKLKRRPEHAHQGINIYPMMDMMTILLVYMVMIFSSSTASAIGESDELRIPYSVSDAELLGAIPIQIARSSIVVNGEEVCQLRDGQVDPGDKQNGASGFKIIPLHRVMQRAQAQQEQLAAARGVEFEGDVLIIANRDTPYRTISEVLYTLGQSGFARPHFVAGKTSDLGGPQ